MRLARQAATVVRMGAGLALLRLGAWLVGPSGIRDTRVSPPGDDGVPAGPPTPDVGVSEMISSPARRRLDAEEPTPLPGSLAAQLRARKGR